MLLALLVALTVSAAPPIAGSPRAVGAAFADLAEQVGPTTVHIEADTGRALSSGLEQLARDYALDLPQRASEGGPVSTGSGVIIDSSGLVLTNHHVVGGAATVTVTLHDRRRFQATVVGSDSRTDIAVLQIDARAEDLPFPAAAVGDSDAIRVGEWVMAVGHPFDFQFSVTVGILSARGRRDLTGDEIQDYLQTDAAVNPGSSGGPLFNLDGGLVGINTAIFNPGNTAQNAGIAFAIPSKMAVRIARELQETGRVGRATLGLQARTRAPADDNPRPGAEVTRIVPDGPAEAAGLRRGDVVIAVDGEPVVSERDLRSVVLARGPDAPLVLRIERGTRVVDVSVVARAARDLDYPGLDLPPGGQQWAGLVLAPADDDALARLGVNKPDDDRYSGVLVVGVAPASAGAAAGLAVGDILLAAGGTPIEDPTQFLELVAGQRSAAVRFWRDGGSALAVVGGLERRTP